MKSLLALGLLVLALSLCNLMGRRGNTNDNANSRSSGTASETGASPGPERNSTPREDLSTGAAPASQQSGPGSSRAGVPPPPPASATPRPGPPKTISGGVLNGKAISKPQPAYPPIARAAHASGTVSVQVLVDERGNVVSAQAVSGHPLLRASAEAAARQAKFSPTLLSGQPVK